MAQIPADVVDATWQRIGAAEPAAISLLQRKCGQSQEELTAFVIGFSEDLRPEAMGLVLYTMVAVQEVFRRHHVKVRKARERVVIRQWETAKELIRQVRESGVRRQDILSTHLETTEPFVLRCIIEAFTEQSDDDPIEISDDEFWHMLAVLKTVIETLHEMAGAEKRSV